MAANIRDVCQTVRKFFSDHIPPEQIKAPVGLHILLDGVSRERDPSGNFKIDLARKAWGGKHLHGMFKRYPDHAEIFYSEALNLCWRRFVVCKEATHLLIDNTKKHFTSNPVELVRQMLLGAPTLTPDDPVNSEKLAVVAAVEMLMPWSVRQKIDTSLADIEIARQFSVPETVVNYALRSKYFELSADCNGALDDPK